MTEKVKPYLDKAKAFLKKIPKKIMIALAVLLVAALAVVFWLNSRPYSVLFTDLTSKELSSILSYLEDAGATDYKVENNDTILVPGEQEADLKAQLLMEGYPKSGFAYSEAEATGMLSTESERSAAALEKLAKRMSDVVSCFDGVKEAAVTINPGEDHRYVLDSGRSVKASASVFVRMEEGETLTKAQGDAIRNLVAHSVKGLEIDSVVITDGMGNVYGDSVDSAADGEASALKLQLEQEWENKIRTNVLTALTPWYGEDNVRVSVSCTVDVSQVEENNTEVFLPEWAEDGSTNGRGIVGSRIYNYVVVRDGEKTTGGVVGSSTNSDTTQFPEYVEDLPGLNGNEEQIEASGQTDYDNPRSEKHIIRTAGYLTDCMISVSINETTAGTVNKTEIMKHVARAAGITGTRDEETGEEYLDDKISVMAMPFYEKPAVLPVPNGGVVPSWAIYAGIAGLVLFLILLAVILFILRRRKKKKAAAEGGNYDVDAILAAAAANSNNPQEIGADVMSMQSERSVELRKDIRKFAEDNPEIAAQMLRGWLRGDDDNG